MPLGILSDEEFAKELEIYKDEVRKPIVEINNELEVEEDKLTNQDKASVINNSIARVGVEYKDIPVQGRNPGDVNKPDTLRNVIAQCKIEGATNRELKEVFNVSDSAIHAYENAKTSTSSNKVDKRLAKFVRAVRCSVTRKASRKMIAAIDAISDEKILELKGTELSVLAKNMSSIIADQEEKSAKLVDNSNKIQFNIFVPPQKSVSDYEVIDVGS